MCNPALFMLASTAVTVYGQQAGARSQRRQLASQAAAAEEQAQAGTAAAYEQAAQTREEVQAQAKLIRDAAVRVRGSARAGYAASGVRVGEGSAALVDEDILRDSESDAAMTILTGERRARSIEAGGEADARSLRAGAGNARQAGRDATRAGWIGSAGTVLGAASSYGQWATAMKSGQTAPRQQRGYFGYGDPAAGY